jgi:hypothetical protein
MEPVMCCFVVKDLVSPELSVVEELPVPVSSKVPVNLGTVPHPTLQPTGTWAAVIEGIAKLAIKRTKTASHEGILPADNPKFLILRETVKCVIEAGGTT